MVKQNREVEFGGRMHTIDHDIPIQFYSQREYDRMAANDNERFKALGIVPEVLHGSGDEEAQEEIENTPAEPILPGKTPDMIEAENRAAELDAQKGKK